MIKISHEEADHRIQNSGLTQVAKKLKEGKITFGKENDDISSQLSDIDDFSGISTDPAGTIDSYS